VIKLKNHKPLLPRAIHSQDQTPVGIEDTLDKQVSYKTEGFFKPQPPLATTLTPLQESMDDWLDDAMNSTDIRNRIAVTTGVSRGVFGRLHLGGIEGAAAASNDDQYCEHKNEGRHCA